MFELGHNGEAMFHDPNHPAHASGGEGMWFIYRNRKNQMKLQEEYRVSQELHKK